MKKKNLPIVTPTRRMLAMALALLALGAITARSQSPIPSEWTFEEFLPGQAIVATNGAGILGWQGRPFPPGTNDALVVRDITYTETGSGYPVPTATHSNVVELFGDVSNRFAQVSNTNVWIDLSAMAGRLSTTPVIPLDLQMAVFFNTNGQLMLHHGVYIGTPEAGGFAAVKHVWSELNNPEVPSNGWVRLTVEMNYLPPADPAFDPETQQLYTDQHTFFQIRLDGEPPLTSSNAYREVTLRLAEIDTVGFYPSSAADPGTWFMTAESGFGVPTDSQATSQNPFITDLAFQGAGLLDDIVVTDTQPTFGVGPTWIITPNAGANGIITPGTPQIVQQGATRTFNFAATEECWGVSNVIVDAIIDSVTNTLWEGRASSYTFNFITNDFNLYVSFAPLPPIEAWLCRNDLTLADWELDLDEDGASTAEEYYAGTDPNTAESVFRVIREQFFGSSNLVVWTGTTNSGVNIPFVMLRSTNILSDATWDIVDTDLHRDESGTNIWYDLNPPMLPAYYRPAIPTNAP